MSAANEVKQQLHMLHNPFSQATSQPKIPDGKSTRSLGFAQQSVLEFSGNDELEMLLFPGLNACCIIKGLTEPSDQPSGTSTRSYYIPKFQGSNVCDWGAGTTDTTTFNVRQAENYAYWRHVSVGMQLKLLNAQEEDDGWWEACRVTAELDNNEWLLTTVNGSSDRLNDGVLAPVNQLFTGINLQSITNETTYSTGLLRDLHRVQFELHTLKDHSEFIHMPDSLVLQGSAMDTMDLVNNFETSFNAGYDQPRDLIEKFSDTNMDAVYVKLHCRPTGSTASRFHLNQVMNTEVIFDPAERESRFMTRSHNIGTGSASIHMNVRRSDGNAAAVVTE